MYVGVLRSLFAVYAKVGTVAQPAQGSQSESPRRLSWMLSAAILIAGAGGESSRPACANPNVVVAGQVVDERGTAVPRATVLLNNAQDDIPVDGAGGTWPLYTAETDERGNYAFSTSEDLDLWRAAGRWVRIRAVQQERVSDQEVLRLGEGTARVDKLVLHVGQHVRISLDGLTEGLASDQLAVSLLMLDRERLKTNRRAGLYSMMCRNDGNGEYVTDRVPDREYSDYLVRVSGSQGSCGEYSASDVQVDTLRPALHLRVALPSRRSLFGRVLESTGKPAAGYLVAPWRTGQTSVLPEKPVETDELGRFAILDGNASYPYVAVYRDASGSLPLVLSAVPSSGADSVSVGDLRLPVVASLRFSLKKSTGGPLEGQVFLFRADMMNATRRRLIDAGGVVEFSGVPTNVELVLRVEANDARYGELIEEFRVPVGASPVQSHTVSGRGMLLVRFMGPSGPVSIAGPHLRWGPDPRGEGSWDGERSEVRQLLRPGAELRLELWADGVQTRTIERVLLLENKPTILEVTVK